MPSRQPSDEVGYFLRILALPVTLTDSVSVRWSRQVEGRLEEMLLLAARAEEYNHYMLAKMGEATEPAPLSAARHNAFRCAVLDPQAAAKEKSLLCWAPVSITAPEPLFPPATTLFSSAQLYNACAAERVVCAAAKFAFFSGPVQLHWLASQVSAAHCLLLC